MTITIRRILWGLVGVAVLVGLGIGATRYRIEQDNRVVGISQGYAKTPYFLIPSPGEVNYVLEVNQNSGIKVGDQVKIN